jgi:glycosyltransferase involved in cell wall biosynthesis
MIELVSTSDGARQATSPLSWLRDPVKPALQVLSALDQVRRAPAILPAMRLLPDVRQTVDEAVRDGIDSASVLAPILEAIDDDHDSLTALAAVHALGRVPGPAADAELAELILDAVPGFEDHALWAMTERPATTGLVRPVARAVARGGLPGMHAQRVLSRWSDSMPNPVLVALERILQETTSPAARRYLVETIGLVRGPGSRLSLERVATDVSEGTAVRAAAISAFAERITERLPRGIRDLASTSDELGVAVRTVRAQRQLARRGPRVNARRDLGIRVAQIHLSAPLVAGSAQAGMGEAGGLASLLSQLGPALAQQPRLAEVITIGRTLPHETQPSTRSESGQRDERIILAAGEGATFASRWPSVVAATRGIRAALLGGPTPDAIHLRMADPGSLAGAALARELGIPVVFTLAPDPHGPIASAEAAGTLDRRTFAEEDARSALWYRADLVERLARQARELVLFPRPNFRAQLRELTGIDIGTGAPNHTIVPEGIDMTAADRAAVDVTADANLPVIDELERAIAKLPHQRHGLPLVVSVGRLHEAKGMTRLVEAFARDAELAMRTNLVIVGGDLDEPTAAEVAELARIRKTLDRYPGLAQRVILFGHRPNSDVGLVLASARAGQGSLIAPGGAYACGSAKEEFGLAIIEAMAAGLPVVAPRTGGPATYVEPDVTGVLVDTTDSDAIASGALRALHLAADAGTARRARETVESRFTLERMARTLAAVYRITAGASTLGLPVDTSAVDAATTEAAA